MSSCWTNHTMNTTLLITHIPWHIEKIFMSSNEQAIEQLAENFIPYWGWIKHVISNRFKYSVIKPGGIINILLNVICLIVYHSILSNDMSCCWKMIILFWLFVCTFLFFMTNNFKYSFLKNVERHAAHTIVSWPNPAYTYQILHIRQNLPHGLVEYIDRIFPYIVKRTL